MEINVFIGWVKIIKKMFKIFLGFKNNYYFS